MKKYTIFSLMFLLLFAIISSSFSQEPTFPRTLKSKGMAAYPFLTTVTQPDGSEARIMGRGDGVVHWYETGEGYSVLKDEKGFFVYAIADPEKGMVPSQFAVGATKGVPPGITPGLSYSNGQLAAFSKAYFDGVSAKSNPTSFPPSGNNSVLVILAEYPDFPSTITTAEIENMLMAPGYNGGGSFRDYYLDISYNNLDLDITVVPWVMVSQNMSYYGANDIFGYDLRPHELVREALDIVEADGFDFSQFDNDNDGYVDEIIMIHSGYGEQYTGAGDSCIWSHAYHLGDLSVVYDGVRLDNYLATPELFGNSGTAIASIGTVVHEFAHSLAIPDLYDIDLEGSGGYAFDLNFWDLMAVGSWNDNGETPAGINAWLKRYMGWMTIPVIDTVGSFTLNPAMEFQEAYQLNTPVYNEYFIVENRQQTGFDRYIPGNGMLIYHVDLNYPGWLTGMMNVDPDHQGFDLVEADNIRDTLTLAGDPFPGTAAITGFDSLTTPSSNTWDGNSSLISIQNISSAGGVISFDILGTTYDEIPEGWDVKELEYTRQGLVNGMVIFDGGTAVTGYLAAFVDDVCRGVGTSTYNTSLESYVFELNVFSNTTGTETVHFLYYDPVGDSIYALYESLQFVSGTMAGSPGDPFIFHTPVHFTKSFTQGWNWFSLNVETGNMSPSALFTNCVAAGDYIKNQRQSTTYYAGYGWFGTLHTMNTKDLFIINAKSVCGIDIWGLPVLPSSQPIDLVAGWNWLAYTPREPMDPSDAMASLTPTHLDYIKNQTQSSTFYSSFGWFGTLKEMKPGEGYMMRLVNADQLIYPDEAPAKKKNAAEDTGRNPSLSFDPFGYEHNATLTAKVELNGLAEVSEKDILFAWVGNECRGEVRGIYFEPADIVVFPLMVHSNAIGGEEISFTYYNSETETSYSIEESAVFEKDMVLGDAFEAVELNVAEPLKSPEFTAGTSAFTLFPNPVSEIVTIDFHLKKTADVRIEIYDIYGNLVEVLTDDSFNQGGHSVSWRMPENPSGTYLIMMSDGYTRLIERLIHLD